MTGLLLMELEAEALLVLKVGSVGSVEVVLEAALPHVPWQREQPMGLLVLLLAPEVEDEALQLLSVPELLFPVPWQQE